MTALNPRTCVGCRQRADATELLRIVRDPDAPSRLIPDPRRRCPGRGAHLHPETACYEAAVRRKALARAFRASGALDDSALREYVAEHGQA